MKNIEKLKQEQVELKERLLRLIDFINSDEYFTIPEAEKSLFATQRTGMEMYLTALTNRIYGDLEFPSFSISSFLPLMVTMMSMSSSWGSGTSSNELKKLLDESKESNNSAKND